MKHRLPVHRPVDNQGQLAAESGRPVLGYVVDENAVLEVDGPDDIVQQLIDSEFIVIAHPDRVQFVAAGARQSPTVAELFEHVTWTATHRGRPWLSSQSRDVAFRHL